MEGVNKFFLKFDRFSKINIRVFQFGSFKAKNRELVL